MITRRKAFEWLAGAAAGMLLPRGVAQASSHADLIQLYEAPADGFYHFKHPTLGVASLYGDALTMWSVYPDVQTGAGRVMLVWSCKRSACSSSEILRLLWRKRATVLLIGDGSHLTVSSDIKVIAAPFDQDANAHVARAILRAKKVSAPGNWYDDVWLFRDWAQPGVDALEFSGPAACATAVSAHAALAYLSNTGCVQA